MESITNKNAPIASRTTGALTLKIKLIRMLAPHAAGVKPVANTIER
jgi:hypothetical protein